MAFYGFSRAITTSHPNKCASFFFSSSICGGERREEREWGEGCNGESGERMESGERRESGERMESGERRESGEMECMRG